MLCFLRFLHCHEGVDLGTGAVLTSTFGLAEWLPVNFSFWRLMCLGEGRDMQDLKLPFVTVSETMSNYTDLEFTCVSVKRKVFRAETYHSVTQFSQGISSED